MARKTSKAPTRIWKFGARIETQSLDRAWDLIRANNRYYNALVRLHAEHVSRYRAIRAEHVPQLAELKEDYERARERVQTLRDQAKAARAAKQKDLAATLREKIDLAVEERRAVAAAEKAERTRVETGLKGARTEMAERIEVECGPSDQRTAGPRTVERVTREVREAMWGEPKWPALWVALDQADAERGAAGKRLRGESELPSGCYLLVEEAVQSAIKKSRPDLPSERSISKPTRIGVQVTGTVTWAEVVSGRCPRVRVEAAPDAYTLTRDGRPRKRAGSERIRRIGIRIATRPDTYVWATMHMHREPPEDTVVKWVWIHVRRQGGRLVAQAQLTVEHPTFSEPRRPAGTGHVVITPCCVVHESGIAVAQWTGDDGESGSIVVPRNPLGASRRTRQPLLARLVYTEAWSSALDSVHATALHVLDPGTDARTLPARCGLERMVAYFCEQRWGRDRLNEMWRQWRSDREELIDRPRSGQALGEWWPEATAAWVRKVVPGAAEADVLAWWGWTYVRRRDTSCADVRMCVRRRFVNGMSCSVRRRFVWQRATRRLPSASRGLRPRTVSVTPSPQRFGRCFTS